MKLNRRQFLSAAAIAPALYLPMLAKSGGPSNPPGGTSLLPPNIDRLALGLGVGIPWQLAESDPTWYDTVISALQPLWWYNWLFDQMERPGYMPMFWRPEKGKRWDAAVEAANQYPDKLWMLFNEPERGDQANEDPVTAAGLANDWLRETHTFFSVAGVIPWDGGIEWLQRYLDAGGPLPSAWHFHLYGADSGEEWQRFLFGPFRDWYNEEGNGLPVYVTETNANRTHDITQQAEVMLDIARNWYPVTPIIGAGWYSAYDVFERWPQSNLVDRDGNPTRLGEFFTLLTTQPAHASLTIR